MSVVAFRIMIVVVRLVALDVCIVHTSLPEIGGCATQSFLINAARRKAPGQCGARGTAQGRVSKAVDWIEHVADGCRLSNDRDERADNLCRMDSHVAALSAPLPAVRPDPGRHPVNEKRPRL